MQPEPINEASCSNFLESLKTKVVIMLQLYKIYANKMQKSKMQILLEWTVKDWKISQ